jgi:predicted nucleotidyltransferase
MQAKQLSSLRIRTTSLSLIKQMLPNNSNLTLLPAIFSRYPEIQAVYLFGSSASHRTHFDSDLDLAVYPGTESLKSQKL